MQFYAHHGAFEQERLVGNDFEVSLRIEYPLDRAAESDNLADTLNALNLGRNIERHSGCRDGCTLATARTRGRSHHSLTASPLPPDYERHSDSSQTHPPIQVRNGLSRRHHRFLTSILYYLPQ